MTIPMQNFPLLNEIDEQINSDNIDWNENAFQTLLTSNLPQTTIFYYAIDVGLRRLESSLYEVYWDATADALNDLSQYLFNIPSSNDTDSYLYEAKCQLLFYASIAIIKLNTIRRRSVNDAKISCATMCLLLLEQSKSYENTSIKNQYPSCALSMRSRYLKRLFLIGQWLPTLSNGQFQEIQLHHDRYMETLIDHLFPAVPLRDKINSFIDNCLMNNTGDHECGDDEATTSSFVFIRRFPKFNEKTIDKLSDLMHMGLVQTLNQLNKNSTRKLIYCIWTLSCMIEADRVALGVLNYCITRQHLSHEPIDFEQKPVAMNSLNERDVIVFLLLCAQQNVHFPGEGDSSLHPYLLYSSSHLCTQNQKLWWQTATGRTSWPEFVDHLATVRLDAERYNQYPPKRIQLETAKILFKNAETEYEQHSNRSASSYEQYAIQYFQTAKGNLKNEGSNETLRASGMKNEKYFFFYPQKSIIEKKGGNEKLIEECEKLARQCDELKLLPEPEPPRASSPTKNETEFHISSILSPVHGEQEEEKHSPTVDSTLFATPPSNKSRNADVQTIAPLPLPPPISPMVELEQIFEPPSPPMPPLVDMLFSHMNGVNQWINRFYTSNEGIQNDIHTIRDRLERLNRATSQMIFSNVKIFQSNPSENNEHFYPPHQ